MDSIQELSEVAEKIGKGFEEFKASYDARLTAEVRHREELERKMNLASVAGNRQPDTASRDVWIDTKSGQRVPVLTNKQRLADLETNVIHSDFGTKALPSMGRVMRGIILGGRADDAKELADERKALSIQSDPSGGYTVPSALSSQWIDALRARMVLTQAGARTVPMPGKSLTLARVTGDPTVAWHNENANISTGDPTFGAVTLEAKTCVAVVKFSLELAQDSANLEQILQATLVNAAALAIDRAGLVGITTGAGAAPDGIFNLAGRNSVTGIAIPDSWDFLVNGIYELLLDNVALEDVGAFIAHPAVWKKMRKLKTADLAPMPAPEEVARIPKLWTTSAPLTGTTADGIIADWRDLLFGVRQDITVRVLSESFLGSNLQIAMLVYARVDFAAARQVSFCTLEGITVSA